VFLMRVMILHPRLFVWCCEEQCSLTRLSVSFFRMLLPSDETLIGGHSRIDKYFGKQNLQAVRFRGGFMATPVIMLELGRENGAGAGKCQNPSQKSREDVQSERGMKFHEVTKGMNMSSKRHPRERKTKNGSKLGRERRPKPLSCLTRRSSATLSRGNGWDIIQKGYSLSRCGDSRNRERERSILLFSRSRSND